MKILKYFVLFASLAVVATSCKGGLKEYDNISQLRDDLFFCENDTFSLTAYAETGETEPYDDGKKGDVENYMSFRLDFKKIGYENAEIKFPINKKYYRGVFGFSPDSSTLSVKIPVNDFPEKEFSLEIKTGEEVFALTAVSLKLPSSTDYRESVAVCEKAKSETIKTVVGEKYEIKVRLIENGGYNYRYVGFFAENSSVSFLLDAATNEIIAAKEN